MAASQTTNELRINDRIKAREVRLIGPEGKQLGIKLLPEALRMAQRFDMDLVEVAPSESPPVCRIMDFGKFKFDTAQKAKESRRKSATLGVKEMKYRPKIGLGDFGTKTRRIGEFLSEGHRVKVTVMFRGRETDHPEIGTKILDKIAQEVEDIAKVEMAPRQEGRNMTMLLVPNKKGRDAGLMVSLDPGAAG